ncbi:MAG: hypothetical protein EOP06_20675 [Proteobacteria bacterium]|nr:MAG: hypothetical protein EOP06_20675 [Pseudomonadota bacterium]
MTLTPQNITTADIFALYSTPITPKSLELAAELVVKVYNYGAWKWEATTDTELIDVAIKTAFPKLHMNMTIGERVYVGDLFGKRTCVEAQ